MTDGRGRTEPLSQRIYDPIDTTADDFVDLAFMRSTLHSILDSLTEREDGVIAMRYGLAYGIPKTLEEIGQVYGVTRERIRQIESQTMKTLQDPSCNSTLSVFRQTPSAEVSA